MNIRSKKPVYQSLYLYSSQNGFDKLIEEYKLFLFELNVQTAERTFIDKVYAVGDYYLSDKVTEYSRHLYDLYKLLEIVELNDNLNITEKILFETVSYDVALSAIKRIMDSRLF